MIFFTNMVDNFQSAIREGGDVDPGYYGAMMLTYAALIAFLVMGAGLSTECYFDPLHKFDALQLGKGMGLVMIAYAGGLTAVGAFKRLDRPVAGTLIKTASQSSIETPAPDPKTGGAP